MLWSTAAPSAAAEKILSEHHRPTIIPAPLQPLNGDKLKFHHHLVANGVGRYFDTDEIVTPNDKAKAESVGYDEFVPPEHTWGVVTLLVWIADQMRHEAGSPVKMRNLWRPMSYNRLVSTSGIESDHPNACGMDLDFKTSSARQEAEDWMAALIEASDNAARLSIGLGHKTLHVGVLSPCGSRSWKYKSYGSEEPIGPIDEMEAYGYLGNVHRDYP